VFTQPVDARLAADVKSYTLSSYTYLLHEPYGSPETDTAPCEVESALVSPDGRRVALVVTPLRRGYVHELTLRLSSADGEPILHDRAYYTLGRIPK